MLGAVPTHGALGRRPAEVERHVARLGDHDPWFRAHPVRVTWSLDWPATEQAIDSPLVTACVAAARDVTALTGRPVVDVPAAMLGVCDASWLAQLGVPGDRLRSGRDRKAHAADESVAVTQLLDATSSTRRRPSGSAGSADVTIAVPADRPADIVVAGGAAPDGSPVVVGVWGRDMWTLNDPVEAASRWTRRGSS